MIQSLSGAVEALFATPKVSHPAVKLPMPTYRGYDDLLSARDFLESLTHYQRAMGLTDQVVLAHIIPAALTDTAARWHRLAGHRAATLEEFRAAFLREFLPANYERRMRLELELRTQAPDESLLEYVRAMEDLFSIAEPRASNEERVERTTRQAHPAFSTHLRGDRFRDFEELAAEAKRLQGDILAARAYHPPSPASEALEPRCEWRGAMPLPNRRPPAQPAFAVVSGQNEVWELCERALDPYCYRRRTACAAPFSEPRAEGPQALQRTAVRETRISRPSGRAAGGPRQGEAPLSRDQAGGAWSGSQQSKTEFGSSQSPAEGSV
ncbi:uncharacterized protein LOC144094401 [Amblyomma americanum]